MQAASHYELLLEPVCLGLCMKQQLEMENFIYVQPT